MWMSNSMNWIPFIACVRLPECYSDNNISETPLSCMYTIDLIINDIIKSMMYTWQLCSCSFSIIMTQIRLKFLNLKVKWKKNQIRIWGKWNVGFSSLCTQNFISFGKSTHHTLYHFYSIHEQIVNGTTLFLIRHTPGIFHSIWHRRHYIKIKSVLFWL